MLSRYIHITGVKVNYYFICKTKLWLFSHYITMERESDRVALGKLIHETSYRDREKDITVDNTVSFDFIKKGDVMEIHDVKLTNRMEKADIYQMLYYLYYLHTVGIDAVGILNYPKMHKIKKVELTEDKISEIETILEDIEDIIKGPFIKPEKKKICRKCSYYEFCFGGDEE